MVANIPFATQDINILSRLGLAPASALASALAPAPISASGLASALTSVPTPLPTPTPNVASTNTVTSPSPTAVPTNSPFAVVPNARNVTFPLDGSCNLNLFEPYCPTGSLCRVYRNRTQCEPKSSGLPTATTTSAKETSENANASSSGTFDFCFIGQSTSWPIAIILDQGNTTKGVPVNQPCQRCPQPDNSTLTHQLIRKFGNNAFETSAWSTFGDCNLSGFCARDNLCHARKENFHMCTGNNQCASGLCEWDNNLNNRMCHSTSEDIDISMTKFLGTYIWVTLAGAIIAIIGTFIAIMYRRKRKLQRKEQHDLETVKGNNTKKPSTYASVGSGKPTSRDRIRRAWAWLNKDAHALGLAASITISLGIGTILFSILYPAFASYAHNDNDI